MLRALRKLSTDLKHAWRDARGQDIAEYALMLTLILLITVAAISGLGSAATNVFSNVANKLTGP